jgi:tetratricopeptide (TPR) repeat protein
VSQFLHAANKAQADSSKKLFLKAVDVFRNGKNPFGAIELFLSSLSVYPTASTYYELGNAYLEKGKFNLALQSFQMAEGLGYDPLSQVLFKQACCYAELDSDQAYEYISYAVENGFVDRNKIFNSPHFAKFRDDAQLQSVYYDAMSGNGDPDEILWHGYLRSYKAARLPLALDSGYFRRMGEPRSISYDYENYIPEMRDGKFSRDVGSIYFYVARLTSGNAFTTLVYG